ncbi:HTH-type transcriptional regulator BetI [Paenarthrobacter nitroguajacolicus]|nr:HTH-type transcriptional regulator BetI [Paenarthrobacter nitroguajacolicus]
MRTGRPVNGGGNRASIIAAARQEFAAHGYRGATLRLIAMRAGVDVALLSHYFGNKDGLFAETLELPEEARRGIAAALSTGPIETRGEQVTRCYLGLWEAPATREQMLTLARSGISNEAASTRLRNLLTGPTGDTAFDGMPAGARAGIALAMAELLGVAIARHLFHIQPIAELEFETLVARTTPSIQRHFGST